MNTTIRKGVLVAATVMVAAGCTRPLETTLEQLTEARSLSADALVQFTESADAGNRTVVAMTDDAASAFARAAEAAMLAVQKDVDTLRPILGDLGYSAERGLLEEFARCFAEYRTLNQRIIGLAAVNKNLKARRLSFGSGQEAADASLARSLGERRAITAQCEDTLRALQEALAKRGFSGTR